VTYQLLNYRKKFTLLYSVNTQPPSSTLVDPSLCTQIWINWEKFLGKHGTGINFHKYPAVDLAGFDEQMKPVLEGWSK
jgi:hypothetical protein